MSLMSLMVLGKRKEASHSHGAYKDKIVPCCMPSGFVTNLLKKKTHHQAHVECILQQSGWFAALWSLWKEGGSMTQTLKRLWSYACQQAHRQAAQVLEHACHRAIFNDAERWLCAVDEVGNRRWCFCRSSLEVCLMRGPAWMDGSGGITLGALTFG